MKTYLVFDDWRADKLPGYSVMYTTAYDNAGLDNGDFHPGTTFDAEIDLDPEQEAQLRQAAGQFIPVFRLVIDSPAPPAGTEKER